MSEEPTRIVVDSRVRIPLHQLGAELADQVRGLFTHENRHYAEKKAAGYPVGEEQPIIRTWRHEPATGDAQMGWLSLPRGGMSRVRDLFRSTANRFAVEDQRCAGSHEWLDRSWPMPPHRVELWGFQERVLAEAKAIENCLVKSSTGSGKTTAALALISRIGLPALVVVWTGGLLEQWLERLEKEMGLSERDVGIIGQGKARTATITLAMQQALARGIRPEWLQAFGVVVADEVQRFAAPTMFAAIDPWPARYRIGVSADHTRKDRKEFLIHDLFGRVAVEVKESEVVAAGKTVEVEVVLVPSEFEAPWYQEAMASGQNWLKRRAQKRLVDEIEGDHKRNAQICALVRDLARGEQVIVLSNRRDHCLALARDATSMGVPSGVMLGGALAKQQFRRAKEGVRDGSVRAVFGTVAAIGTGQDFPSVARGVLAMPMHGNRQLFGQVRGRFCRACEAQGKERAVLYVVWDRAVHGRRAVENLARWNRQCSVQQPDGSLVPAKEWLAAQRGGKRRASRVDADDLEGAV